MRAALSIVAGLVAGVLIAVAILGGIVVFGPEPLPSATPVPTVAPSSILGITVEP